MPVQWEEGLYLIDLRFQKTPGTIGAYLLVAPDGEAALVEAGPGSTAERLLEGIAAAGVAPEQITRILLTHIHLDHAGAAGLLTRRLPNAVVCVSAVGAPHLLDPGKLLASARRIYGDYMETLWGPFLPVPAGRLTVIEDGDRLTAGGRALQAVYTPGHASHHLAYYDSERGRLFTGDIAGIRLAGHRYILPPTPPPDLDLAAWSASLDRIAALSPQTLFLTHFGPFVDAPEHLESLRATLDDWTRRVRAGLRAGKTRAELVVLLQETIREGLQHAGDAAATDSYALVGSPAMGVDGYLRYFRKFEPDLPPAA